MKYLDLTFTDPAANLACDEALVEFFEAKTPDDGLLRIWQPTNYFIVLGHSNRLHSEVDCTVCAARQIPILRRISGGGTVMQGPGCLDYSLILNSRAHGLSNIADAFHYVLRRHGRAIETLIGAKTSIEGISDLTLAGCKFSGNAQYRKAHHILVHGTFLLQFDLALIEKYLKIPIKQPDYRHNRPHLKFIANLGIESAKLRNCLRSTWNAVQEFSGIPTRRIDTLIDTRYGREEWSRKF